MTQTTAMPDADLVRLVAGDTAADLLTRVGSLRKLFGVQPAPLSDDHLAKTRLAAVIELVRRYLLEELRETHLLNAPRKVRDYLKLTLGARAEEVFVILYLDAQNRLIIVEEAFRGTLTQVSVYPREIVKASLTHNAAALILAHNHPSGVAEPSAADLRITAQLKAALALVDVQIVDHFIVAAGSMVSLAETGRL